MADFIDDCAVPVAMVGLLYALPGTQLTRRLEKEGRLHQGHDVMLEERAGDQCSIGINFDPKRPLRDILTDYKRVVETVYAPENLRAAARKARHHAQPPRPPRIRRWPAIAAAKRARPRSIHNIINAVPGTREIFWNTFKTIARTNPAAVRYIIILMALYMHLGPFSRRVIDTIDQRIAVLDAAERTDTYEAAQFVAAE